MSFTSGLHIAAFTLAIIGAINWGVVGLFDLNLVKLIIGSLPGLERIIYVLVGLGAVYLVVTHQNDCKVCSTVLKK